MKCQNLLLLAGLGISLVFSACNKMKDVSPAAPVAKSSVDSSLVLTPEGYVPAYKVHHIQKGFALMRKGGHMLKIESKSGAIIEDYGEIHSPAATSSSTTTTTLGGAGNIAHGPIPYTENPGWVTNAYWQNTSSTPITYLITAWVVPSLPASSDGQTIFLFNGLEASDGSTIVQPVLQWGPSDAGNADGWGIANWYVWNGIYATSDLLPVQPGAILEGAITYTGQNGSGSYDYTSTFYNLTTNAAYDNTLDVIEGDQPPNGYTIPSVPDQVIATETLEAYNSEGVNSGYGVVQASDYPAGQNYLNLYDILVNVGGTTISNPAWTVINNNVPHGESTDLTPKINNSTNKGQAIWIYWHPVPTIGGAVIVGLTTTSTSYTITGYPGTVVSIELTANSILLRKESGTTTATMTATTAGVTFSNGSTSISSTNGSAYYTVTMPASGSFTVNASYTSTGAGLKDVAASVF